MEVLKHISVWSVALNLLNHTVCPGALMVDDVLTPGLLSSQIELIMEAIHKNRNLQYKKTMEVKQMWGCFLSCGLMLLTQTHIHRVLGQA